VSNTVSSVFCLYSPICIPPVSVPPFCHHLISATSSLVSSLLVYYETSFVVVHTAVFFISQIVLLGVLILNKLTQEIVFLIFVCAGAWTKTPTIMNEVHRISSVPACMCWG
jgi:hypothetical protein